MSRRTPGRFWLLAIPAGVALVASIMVPLALAQSRPASVVAQTTQGFECNERNLDFPLEVNVEETGPRFKTIAMEKEVFHCGEGPQEVRDVELFIETVEQVLKDPLRVRHIETRAEVATCTKRFAGGFNQTGGGPPFAVCDAQNVSVEEISPEESGALAASCTLNESQPADPVEMATTETEGVIKTVNVEKERMFCDFAGKGEAGPFGPITQFQAEVFLFTEILEATRRVTIDGATRTSIRPIAKEFIAVVCAKDPETGQVFGCFSFTPVFEQGPE